MATRPRECKKNINYAEVNNIFVDVKEKKVSKDKLYEVEIVERDQANKRVKLHYIGCDKCFDEWRNESADDELCFLSKISKVTIPSSDLDERKLLFLEDVRINIQKLLIHHRSTDPFCKLEVGGSNDVFNVILEACELKQKDKKTFYAPSTLKHLESLFGCRWYVRIENQKGDFCYIREGTFKVWVYKPKVLKSFQKYGDKYVEHIQEQRPVLKISFVRTRGNRRLYTMLEKDF